MTTQLTFQIGDAKWHRLREKAKGDLEFFVTAVLPYGSLVPFKDAVHRGFLRFLARQTGIPRLDEAPYRLCLMPRDTGKSTFGTQGYNLWQLIRDPDRAVVIANEKEANASKFLLSIQKEFEGNDLLRALFPEVVPGVEFPKALFPHVKPKDFNKIKWSTTEMEVNRQTNRKEPSILATGVGGSITGMHPNEIFSDDLISLDAMRNAKVGARQVLESVNDWIKTLHFLPSKNDRLNGLAFVGTHWWFDDCYHFATKFYGDMEEVEEIPFPVKLDDGTTQTLTAYRAGRIAWLKRSAIEHGRSIWPERAGWSLEELAVARMNDPVLFAANQMNEPSDNLTSDFKEPWLKEYVRLDEFAFRVVEDDGKMAVKSLWDYDRICIIDPGGFSGLGGDDRARAAMILTASDQDGRHILWQARSEKEPYQDTITLAVQWAKTYGIRKFVVEQTAQQIVFKDTLIKALAEKGISCSVEAVTPRNKDKEVRILELEPYFQQGRIYIGTGPEWMEFRQQYSTFPRSARRDLLDALAYGPVVWRKTGLKGQSHEQRQRAELDRLAQRRNATMQWGRR